MIPVIWIRQKGWGRMHVQDSQTKETPFEDLHAGDMKQLLSISHAILVLWTSKIAVRYEKSARFIL